MPLLNTADALYLGDQEVDRVYLGVTQVWPAVLPEPEPTYAEEVLADSPLGYWPLGEPSGAVMVDASGNGRNGAIDAGVTRGASGLLADGTSWALDAAEGGELAAASWMAPATALSAEAWVYLTAYDPQGTVVMCRSEVGASDSLAAKAWSIQVTGTGGVTGRVYTDAGATTTAASPAGAVPLNTLCHLVLVYNGTTVQYYVDGALVATAALVGVPVSYASNTKPLSVGRTIGAGLGTYSYTGRIQHAAFYGTALSPTRIRTHYWAGRPSSGSLDPYAEAVLDDRPVLYWRLDETSGTVADDVIASRNGSYVSTPTLGQASLLPSYSAGKSVKMTAASAQAVSRAHEAWMNTLTTAISVEGWFLFDGDPGISGMHTLVAKESLDAAFANRAWRISFEETAGLTNTLRWSAFVTATTRFIVIAPVGTITRGASYHVVGTYDGAVARLYVNGAQVATEALAGTLRTSATALQVGKDTTTGSKYAMSGRCDEVAIYDTVLSPARVLAHYEAGT